MGLSTRGVILNFRNWAYQQHCILLKDLGLHAYKVQLTQELKPVDHEKRRTFTDWVLEMHKQDHDFSKKIILSDEAHFHLSGYVNKQNCHIWGSENAREIVEQPLHPQRVTVFGVAVSLGHIFSENDACATVSVNGLHYRTMLTDFFWPEIDAMDVDDVYFQQDGSTCHPAGETIALF